MLTTDSVLKLLTRNSTKQTCLSSVSIIHWSERKPLWSTRNDIFVDWLSALVQGFSRSSLYLYTPSETGIDGILGKFTLTIIVSLHTVCPSTVLHKIIYKLLWLLHHSLIFILAARREINMLCATQSHSQYVSKGVMFLTCLLVSFGTQRPPSCQSPLGSPSILKTITYHSATTHICLYPTGLLYYRCACRYLNIKVSVHVHNMIVPEHTWTCATAYTCTCTYICICMYVPVWCQHSRMWWV